MISNLKSVKILKNFIDAVTKSRRFQGIAIEKQ